MVMQPGFVVMNKGRAIKCAQVCWEVDDMNMKRKMHAKKLKITDHYCIFAV